MSNLRIPGLAGLVGVVKLPGIFWSFSRLGYERRAKNFDELEDCQGKTVLITGANSGLGLAAAKTLISQGSRVLMLVRNLGRGEAAIRDVRSSAKLGGSAELLIADMTDMTSIRRVAKSLAGEPIDALVHNAGSLNSKRMRTDDGHEFDFALHALGPHLLTTLLASALRKTHGQVIFVASGGMYSERFSLAANDWEGRTYDGVQAYAQAKRTQVVLASLWDKHENGFSTYAMHPGWVDTPGVESSLPKFYKRLKRWLRTPAQGADTIVWLASKTPAPTPSGAFWFDRQSVSPYMLPYTRESADESDKLWTALKAHR